MRESRKKRRTPRGLKVPFQLISLFLVSFLVISCNPQASRIERIFSFLPMIDYQSIEYSDHLACGNLLNLPRVDHESPLKQKLLFFREISRFTFSMGALSFLVSEDAMLGFDPADFTARVVARTPSHSITLVMGDFNVDVINKRLIDLNYIVEEYRGYTLYSLSVTDALSNGGLSLAFTDFTMMADDVIVHAPTPSLLKDYIDRLEVGPLTENTEIMEIVKELGGSTSIYISRGVLNSDLYGEDSLFMKRVLKDLGTLDGEDSSWFFPITLCNAPVSPDSVPLLQDDAPSEGVPTPEENGLGDYHLSPYSYFALGIRPGNERGETDIYPQEVTLVIYYGDEKTPELDKETLAIGLERGKSLTRLIPLNELFTVEDIRTEGQILKAEIVSIGDFDIKILIRLNDLPFMVYK